MLWEVLYGQLAWTHCPESPADMCFSSFGALWECECYLPCKRACWAPGSIYDRCCLPRTDFRNSGSLWQQTWPTDLHSKLSPAMPDLIGETGWCVAIVGSPLWSNGGVCIGGRHLTHTARLCFLFVFDVYSYSTDRKLATLLRVGMLYV